SEIRRTEQRLADARAGLPEVDLVSLYGALDLKAQDRAIAPAPPGRRKVVLSTAIAETSLTIEGVRVVVDSGLARVPRYEPDAGVTRLETVRVSRAAADQRRGRAGRTEPGVCFRLWDEPETASLKPFAEPEIRSADLAPLLLDCAAWGASDPTALPWLDSPPAAALAAARDELERLGALTPDGRLTPAGRELNTLALPPRLAHMVLEGGRSNALHAAGLAAVIVEKGLGGRSVDIDARHEGFLRDRSQRAAAMRRLAQDWARSARGDGAARSSGALLALAYPDRIAKARGADGQYLLANGRGARMDAAETLAREPFLVVAEMTGAAAATRILTAARLDESELAAVAQDRIVERDDIRFDTAAGALRAERVRCLDAIVLSREPQPVPRTGEAAALLAAGAAAAGIERLPWTAAQRQLRARVAYLRQADPALPDLSDPGLAATVGDWLAPHLAGKTRIADIPADTLPAALAALIRWDLVRRLDREAPTHFEAPTGNRHPIDYEGADAPSVAVRVQELFGLTQHPVLARGGPPLTLHLLSPAHRPLQITRDLPGFWRGSWRDVRADMRGRYPKHDWPEDPAAARPTTRAKPRSR
ncbi:MAG: ATP-dependent helicase HrpB, partial [Hyphomicrobiaceae bacterium]